MKKNVQAGERVLTLAVAALLLRRGMKRKGLRGLTSLLASGALGLRGMSGYCSLYNALGISTVARRRPRDFEMPTEMPITLRKSMLIRRSQTDVFNFITNFENLNPLLEKTERLHRRGVSHNQWAFELPMGKRVKWDFVVTKKETPSEIQFRSAQDNEEDLQFEGKVKLEPRSEGTRTMLTVMLALQPPGGLLGKAVASSLSNLLEALLKEGLRQIKETLEAGEVPTITGQPKGPTFPSRESEIQVMNADLGSEEKEKEKEVKTRSQRKQKGRAS